MIARVKAAFLASSVQWAVSGQPVSHVLYQHHGYTLTARKVQLNSRHFKMRYELHDRYSKLVTSIALGTSADAAWWKVRMGSFPPPPTNNYWCVELIGRGARPPKWWKNYVRRLAWVVLSP